MFILWPIALMNCPVELNLGELMCTPFLNLCSTIVMPFHPTDLLWHIWLLYYYLSLALRENILKANGSEIHSWWFMHHYISMVRHTPPYFSHLETKSSRRQCPAPTLLGPAHR